MSKGPTESRGDPNTEVELAPNHAIKDGTRLQDGEHQQPAKQSLNHEPSHPPSSDQPRIALQLVISLLMAGGVLIWLVWSPFRSRSGENATDELQPPAEVVRVVSRQTLKITPGTPLANKLAVAAASGVEVSTPMLSVTGSIVARLRPGSGPSQDRWQFNAAEVLSAYTDWQKATSDVEFNKKELAKVRELDEATVAAQRKVVERLRKLVAVGTDSEKDLAAEETNLLQFQITGAKSVHEAETALKQAERSQAALARQLQQAGVAPELLANSVDGRAIVVADVPEAKIGRVRLNQHCLAQFFGFPDKNFGGKVSAIAPIVAKDSRTLRVMFELKDPEDLLKPGMFADIGLGTDPRKMLTIPADGVLHVGRADYVLRRDDSDSWHICEVRLGELHGQDIEILSGLKEGDRVAGKGAILLKPYVVRALQMTAVPGIPLSSAKER